MNGKPKQKKNIKAKVVIIYVAIFFLLNGFNSMCVDIMVLQSYKILFLRFILQNLSFIVKFIYILTESFFIKTFPYLISQHVYELLKVVFLSQSFSASLSSL